MLDFVSVVERQREAGQDRRAGRPRRREGTGLIILHVEFRLFFNSYTDLPRTVVYYVSENEQINQCLI